MIWDRHLRVSITWKRIYDGLLRAFGADTKERRVEPPRDVDFGLQWDKASSDTRLKWLDPEDYGGANSRDWTRIKNKLVHLNWNDLTDPGRVEPGDMDIAQRVVDNINEHLGQSLRDRPPSEEDPGPEDTEQALVDLTEEDLREPMTGPPLDPYKAPGGERKKDDKAMEKVRKHRLEMEKLRKEREKKPSVPAPAPGKSPDPGVGMIGMPPEWEGPTEKAPAMVTPPPPDTTPFQPGLGVHTPGEEQRLRREKIEREKTAPEKKKKKKKRPKKRKSSLDVRWFRK